MTAWILITVRGRAALTAQCLDSILRNTPVDRKIIVVDNGSRDETLDDLYKMFRQGKIHRLICNKVGTVPQWEKGYAIRQAARIVEDEPHDFFAWFDNDVTVKPGWFAAAQLVLEHLTNVEVCSLHNDQIQEKHHKTIRTENIGPYHVRMKLTANGAAWVMRSDFFQKYGLPPIGMGINRSGTEDWYYSDKLQHDGRPRFAVVDGFAEHHGYTNSVKRQAIAKIKGGPIGRDK